jgi:hypothetical protein
MYHEKRQEIRLLNITASRAQPLLNYQDLATEEGSQPF